MKKIANRDARTYVQHRRPFQGSHLFATSNPNTGVYAVYSYGEHWPLFVHVQGQWFENEGRASVTTSKHRSQTHPYQPTVMLSSQWMELLARNGYTAIAKARVVGGGTPETWSFNNTTLRLV